MSHQDRERWDGAYVRKDTERGMPSPFLVENLALLPVGRTLDLACGRGRHARFLAERGHHVTAVDVSHAALADDALREVASVVRVLMDLDAPAFRRGSFDSVVNISFLDRRLFHAIHEWLKPGGVLLFDTFLVDQAESGHPRDPRFLLGRNELLRRLHDQYRVLRYREGVVIEHGRDSYRAGIIAERRAD